MHPENHRHASSVELVILSRLRVSDGGRETWLSQFAPRLISVGIKKLSIWCIRDIDDAENIRFPDSVALNSVPHVVRKLPWAMNFILNYPWRRAKVKAPTTDVVVGVGGLVEALAIFLCDTIFRVKRTRVLWLRTIYLKEKAYRLGRVSTVVLRWLERRLIRWFDAVVANGWDTADYYTAYRSDIVVIPNAVDVEVWRHGVKASLEEPVHVAYIGRLSQVKGIYEYLEAVRRYNEEFGESRPITFHLVGPAYPKDREKFELLIKNAGVNYAGALANSALPAYLKKIDVCVNLTFANGPVAGGGVSNALLEQMAAGKPQIVWDNAVYRQVVDESNGYFADEGSVEQLVAAFQRCANNLSALKDMTSSAQIKSLEFDWDSHLTKFLDVIERDVAKTHKSPAL